MTGRGTPATSTTPPTENGGLTPRRTFVDIWVAATAGYVGLLLLSYPIAAAVVFPALVAARALDHFTWGPFASGVSVTVAGVFAIWALMLLSAQARR